MEKRAAAEHHLKELPDPGERANLTTGRLASLANYHLHLPKKKPFIYFKNSVNGFVVKI